MNRHFYTYMFMLAAANVLFFALSLLLGSVYIPAGSVADIIFSGGSDSEIWNNIIFKSRMPQAITAMLAGAGLAISGLQMQTVFNNPLAGPSVLGISNGASLGVAFVVLLSGSIGGVALSRLGIVGEVAMTIAAIAGSLSVMGLILYASQKINGSVTLLIIGVMIGYVASAVIGVLKYFSVEEDVKAYVIWGLGSFARISGNNLNAFVILMCIILPLSLLQTKMLNLLLLGESYARNLGLNIRRARFYVIGCAGVLTAIVTAYCGPIIFLGLAVPHLCRAMLRTSDHRRLMPASMLAGSALAMLCGIIARMPGFEGALPVNSVTAIIGAPIVVSVLFRKNRNV